MRKVIFAIFLIFLILFTSSPVSAAGFVSCGGFEEPPCDVCDFWEFMNSAFRDWLLLRMHQYFIVMILIAGIYFFFARGNEELISKGKRVLKYIGLGLLMIYGAWALINFTFSVTGVAKWEGFRNGWWQLECHSYERYNPERPENLEDDTPININIPTYDPQKTFNIEYDPSSGLDIQTYDDTEFEESIYDEYKFGEEEDDTQQIVMIGDSSILWRVCVKFFDNGICTDSVAGDRFDSIVLVKNDTNQTKKYRSYFYDANRDLIRTLPSVSGWVTTPANDISSVMDFHISWNTIRAIGEDYSIKIEEELDGILLEITRPIPIPHCQDNRVGYGDRDCSNEINRYNK